MEDIPENSLIITDNNNNNIKKTNQENSLQLSKNMEINEIKRKIIDFLSGDDQNRTIYIGIDPGINIGIAILHKNQLITSHIVLSLNDLVKWIRTQTRNWKSQEIVIRIGDGVKQISDTIITRLENEFQFPIELVDEHATSIKEKNTTTIHEQAAALIAGRKGVNLLMGRESREKE